VSPEVTTYGLLSPNGSTSFGWGVRQRWLMDAARRRVELAAALRKAREATGRTQKEVATFLRCTQGKIAKIEKGANDVKPHDLERLLQLYELAETDLLKIKALAALPGLGHAAMRRTPTEYVDFCTREARASVVLALHSECIPVPLQSDHYRLKLYQEAGDLTPPSTLILDRDRRAEIFTDPNGTTQYRVLLSESALRRLPGGDAPGLAVDQTSHLLDLMARYQWLQLQIVTFKAKIPYMDPDFTVLKYPNSKEDVAYVDSSIDAQLIKATQRVTNREAYWHLVQRAALTTDQTKQILHDLMKTATEELSLER
jgi:transcriptional regulator with XRE-family HTH domain